MPISLFGNHSFPSLMNDFAPGRDGELSAMGRGLSVVFALGTLGALCALFSERATDRWTNAAQMSCIGVLILLVPVYTYEHHLIFALPAAVLAVSALVSGRLGTSWIPPVAISVVVLLFDLRQLKALSNALPDSLAGVAALIRELKFLALVGLLVVTAALGVRKES